MTVEQTESESLGFGDLKLDFRLVEVLGDAGITRPTLIQEKAIPLALLGKDILARAKTGSGKTLAFLLPILHSSLNSDHTPNGITALVIVPTKELAKQVEANLTLFTSSDLEGLKDKLQFVNLAADDRRDAHLTALRRSPPIVVSTPGRLADLLGHLPDSLFTSLRFLVIDEADLVLSLGFSEDIDRILYRLPKLKQTFLMSATMSEDVEKIKALTLRNAAILKLEEGDMSESECSLKQFTISVPVDNDKFLLLFAVLKLGLLKGKMLIFVQSTERAYKLRIFLEEFGIRACCLNPDFPLASRQHMVEEYNRGVYDILIAPDSVDSDQLTRESGVARGIDFKRVDVVVNFDFPVTRASYTHRIGRTARAGQSGTAISFISAESEFPALDDVKRGQEEMGRKLEEYSFDMAQIDGFRYRMADALRAVTRAVIKDTQMADLRAEMANSERLKHLYADRPEELSALLRHDRRSKVRSQPHLKHIPEYLMPAAAKPLPQTCPNPSRRQLKAQRGVFKPKKNRSMDPLKKK